MFDVPATLANENYVTGSVDVEDESDNGDSVSFINSQTGEITASQSLDVSGNYSVSVPDGTYDIKIESTENNQTQVIKKTEEINSDSVINIGESSYEKYVGVFKNNALYLVVVVLILFTTAGLGIYLWRKKQSTKDMTGGWEPPE